jgi:iron-sulfur cluster repair protein YtfE (RIC family)
MKQVGGAEMKASQPAVRISGDQVVNQVIHAHPGTVEVFNRFGIDSCCGGAAPIATAAAMHGADPDEVLDALNAIVAEQR